jgi:plastocyanin
MLRFTRKVAPLGLVLILALQGVADAAPAGSVKIQNFAFSPATGTGPLGTKVTWTNKETYEHTTTNDTTNPDGSPGVGLWSSPLLGFNDTYSFTFRAAGHFTYHCTPHSFMTAEVKVKPKAQPTGGGVGDTFTIQVATQDPPAAFVFDIQMKAPGDTEFQAWMPGSTTMSAEFVPTEAGTYEFRSRVRRVSNNGASYYSPSVSVTVSE